MRPAGYTSLLVLFAACGDGGSEPSAQSLVPRIVRATPRLDSPAGEAGVFIDLEVRDRAGTAYANAIVEWEATHGAVLAPALTDADGELQALWVFTLAVDPSGTAAQLRACARRQSTDRCAYSEPIALEVP